MPLIHEGRLTGDPYHFEGFNREDVKRFVARCIGSGRTATGWKDEDTERVYTFPKALRTAVLARYPFLTTDGFERLLGYRGKEVSKRLMFLESLVLHTVTMRLMGMGIPSLPIHDGTRVPASKVKIALDLIREEFERVTGIVPIVTVKENVVSRYPSTNPVSIEKVVGDLLDFYCSDLSRLIPPEMNAINLSEDTRATPFIASISNGPSGGTHARKDDQRNPEVLALMAAEPGLSTRLRRRDWSERVRSPYSSL